MNAVLDVPKISDAPALAAPVSIKQTVLAQFHATEPDLIALAARYSKVAFDTSTTKGLDAAKSARLDLRNNGRFLIERAEKRIKGEVNDLKRDMADEVARLVSIVQPVEDHVDDQIKAREAVLAAEKAERERIAAAKAAEAARFEASRIAAHHANLFLIREYLDRSRDPGMTAERIAAGIVRLEQMIDFPTSMWDEFAAQAQMTRDDTVAAMRTLQAQAVSREAEAARQEAIRIENQRVAAELAIERARIAAETAELRRQAVELADAKAASERLAAADEANRKAAAATIARAEEEAQARVAAELAAQRAESERLERLAADARRQAEEDMKEAQAVPADFTEVAKPEGAPVAPGTPDMRNWVLLAFRAMNDAAAVLESIIPGSPEEGENLTELTRRIEGLASHVPTLLQGYRLAVR